MPARFVKPPSISSFLLFLLGLACTGPLLVRAQSLDFNRDVRPILSDRCFQCHGPDEKERKAKLRLDIGNEDLDIEELLYRITTDDPDDQMPPPKSKLTLNQGEKDRLRQWLKEGGTYESHWAFQTAQRPPTPAPTSSWPWGAIDRFVLAKLEEAQQKPSPPADARTLIRRVSLDLTGLPPTPEEIDAFLNDSSPGAYERVVDRLLASPRYGERMAIEWMDAARYADTSGYQYDWPRTMWRWRDWVIDAFNQNLSYDQFITWQLAGDLLPDASLEQKIATGFNRNHPFTIEGGTIDEEYRVSYVSDRVTTMGTVFLGLTLECARCHDHKYDSISQRDFFQLYAFFNQVPERGRIGGKPAFAAPAIAAPTPAQAAALAAGKAQLTELQARRDKPRPDLADAQRHWETALPAQDWKVVNPVQFSSTGGTTLQLQEDGSLLATGKNPARDSYQVQLPLGEGGTVSALRVEALTHPSMVGNGPGRSANGNAVLTEVTVDGVVLQQASADYEQKGYPVQHAIDSNSNTGWAFDGNSNHADHAAAFRFASPASGKHLTVTLKFESRFSAHSFGRVRFAVSSSPEADVKDAPGRLQQIASTPPQERSAADARTIHQAFRMATDPDYRALAEQIASLRADLSNLEQAIPQTMIMSDDQKRETFILERGAYDQPREKVEPDTPAHLPPFPSGAPRNRLGLAQWLVDRQNPLTARVTVNRLWHQLFGVGIVKTVNDFGSQADWPSHPELLDWMATEFMESGWDLKGLLKLIVTSSTYRQSSSSTPQDMERDPENRLLARGARFRLPAEMLRDQLLYSGDLLAETVGGPSVKPYQPAGLWKELTLRPNFMQVYEPDTGANAYRRGLYTFWKRAAHHPMMATFDAPNREVCTFSRGATNTPLQALVLLHDPQFVQAARGLAHRSIQSSNALDQQIAYAFEFATSRRPEPQEEAALLQFFEAERNRFQQEPEEARELSGGDVSLAALIMTTRLILNLSETITRS